MSASARKKANQQADNYFAAVMEALASEDETYVDPAVARILPCPVCENLILQSCPHWRERRARRESGGQHE